MKNGSATPAVRILCADDNRFVLDAVRTRLGLEPGFVCVGSVTSADDLIAEAERTDADIVLLDIEMPGRDPFGAMKELSQSRPGTRTLMLSAHVQEQYITAAVEAGAWAYLCKSDSPDEIVRAIHRALHGEFTLGPTAVEHCRRAAGGA